MASSNIIKTKRDGVISHADAGGHGGANTFEISKEAGDFSFSAPGPAILDLLDRGIMAGDVRYGDDQPMSGSYSAYMREATSSSAACLMDLACWDLDGSSYIDSNWTPSLGVNAEVPTSDLQFVVAGVVHGDAADHAWLFQDVSLELASAGDGDPNIVQVNWKSHAAGAAGIRPVRT